jgi:hypothetical protein
MMVCYTLKLRNDNDLPIPSIAATIKATLKATLSDLVTINGMSQVPPTISVELLTAFENPVQIAQVLKGRMGAGVTLEAIN